MELERVEAPDSLSAHDEASELRVATEDADWALAEGRAKLLRASGEVLARIVKPDEPIRLVSTAFASRGGVWLRSAARRAGERLTLVATDRRLLLIHVNAKGRPSLYAHQIPYTSIRRAELGLFGLFVGVETGDGVIKLRGLRRKTQDRLADILDRNPNATEGWQALCPACLQPQPSTREPCTLCGAESKSARTAALRSLVFPGLGDLYLGQTLAGIVTGGMMAIVWTTLLVVFSMSGRESEWSTSTIAAVAAVSALVLVFGHGVSAFATGWRARQARYSTDTRLPTGSPIRETTPAVSIVPLEAESPDAGATLLAAAAKQEPAWSRFGRPILAGVGGIVAFLALFVFLGLVDSWTASEAPLQETDYRYLPTIDDLGEWLQDFEPDPEYVSASKTIYTDGSYSLDYEYDDPEDLFFQATTNVERNPGDALTVYGGARVAYPATYAALDGDIELVDADELFQWGDRSMHVFLANEGETFGQLFMTQKGRIVFSMTISGVYFDQPGDFEEFVLPYLEALAALSSQPHQRPAH